MIDNKLLRLLLWPFSMIYGAAVGLRNVLYETEILKSSRFSLPIISVGNLTMGGAGKTPHVEYIIRLLQPYINVGTLSRGYNRKTSGFRFVTPNDSVEASGDEPLIYAKKYQDVVVAVCESRALAIPEMVKSNPQLQTIVLDDAFQHRSVVPDINILLTQYALPYTKDYLLPMGRLRERANSAERADIVIVTKCPPGLRQEVAAKLKSDLKLASYQSCYFSSYSYGNPYSLYSSSHSINLVQKDKVIILSAIANTDYLRQYLDTFDFDVHAIEYEDHHYFTNADIEYIISRSEKVLDKQGIVLTTEKDAIRLAQYYDRLVAANVPVFVLPIHVQFLFDEKVAFDEEIRNRLLEIEK